MKRARWELRGKRGGYWVAFVSSNGRVIMGNPQQRYTEKRDALRSIEIVRRAIADCGSLGLLEIRDCTEKAKP